MSFTLLEGVYGDAEVQMMEEERAKQAHETAFYAHWMLYAACLMSLVQGIFLSWIRIAEPVYWFLI